MIMQTYNRFDVTFVSGKGCTLTDKNGKEYIDFASGIGVNSVGYAHPEWVRAVTEQSGTLAHVSNLYHTQPASELAARLVDLAGMSNVFFCNSGAEANEGMIKLARKYYNDKNGGAGEPPAVATLKQSFHGRTITTLAATGQDSFHKHFFPFTEGFIHVPPNDLDALKSLDSNICAVMLEVVQGEGGVLPLDPDYLRAVSSLCSKRDWLLLIDEVQTGIGRCGEWFAYQESGILPDAVSFAKGIAGGLPFGGFMAGAKCKDVLQPGDHATTFGGNPICAAAAMATLDILTDIIPEVRQKGDYITSQLKGLSKVRGVRGMGLMIGIETEQGNPREIVCELLNAGLVALTAGTNVVRLLPPLVITRDEIDKGLDILKEILK
jgi:acetylornithine/N-succinyldiaminopimelate aminotransferase